MKKALLMGWMYESCIKKQEAVKALFADCCDTESRYERIIELGRKLPAIDEIYKVDENLVNGCQSLMYLHTYPDNNKLIFEAESDSLISSGLAALLIAVYSGEEPEAIVKCPPDYLQELQINASLTMNRANGLASLHLRMQQEAIKAIVARGG